MLRQIITPSEPIYTIQLPKEMVGKTIEIIAFEIGETQHKPEPSDRVARLKRIKEITQKSLVDLSNFKFNRDEANNYDE